MPSRSKRPCTWPGCGELVASGRCPKHETTTRRLEDERRGSRQERGYGRAWELQRARILRRDRHLCQVCRRRTATEVDHIIERADGGGEDETNLQAICSRCHGAKTGRSEARRRAGLASTPGGIES